MDKVKKLYAQFRALPRNGQIAIGVTVLVLVAYVAGRIAG